MQENFKLITNNFESIFDEFSYKNNKILEENEKMLHEIKCQFKCEIMKLDLNNKKQLELQNESNIKRENEFILFLKSLNSWIEKVEKNHLQELEEITISYQSNKQKLMNSKAKHLFLLNNFENDLFSEIKKIEKNNKGNLPFKLKTLQNGDNFFDINLISKISPIYNINQKNQFFLKKKNIVKPVVENKNKNIKFNDNINNTSKILENMVNISNLNIPNESYEIKEMDSEISMFLANHINNYQEESLNISMPKDEGKWDPAFDSEKSEKNTELNELKKAFEILENFNLFEGVKILI